MESPAFTLKTETIELCEFVRRICGELTVTLDRAGFLYEFEIPEESVLAAVDLDRFRRIIQNLADNAIRYNTAGTTISVQMTMMTFGIFFLRSMGCWIRSTIYEA